MAVSYISSFAGALALNFLLNGTGSAPTGVFAALGSGIASAGTLQELVGAGYSRVQVSSWTVSGLVANPPSGGITFGPASGGGSWTVSAFGLFDSAVSGNQLWAGEIPSGTVMSGLLASFAASGLIIGFNASGV